MWKKISIIYFFFGTAYRESEKRRNNFSRSRKTSAGRKKRTKEDFGKQDVLENVEKGVWKKKMNLRNDESEKKMNKSKF